MIAPCHRTVVHPLKMVLRFLERAIALVDAEGVAEAEAAIPVDVKRRHATRLRGSEIKPRNAGIAGRSGPDPVRIDSDSVSIEAKPEVGHNVGAHRVGRSHSNALVAGGSISGKENPVQTGTSRFFAVRTRSKVTEISKRVSSEEM